MLQQCSLVHLVDLYDYLGAKPNERRRNLIEGEAVYNAEHILLCGYTEKTDTYSKVLAHCVKTSALLDDPHEIVVTIHSQPMQSDDDKESRKIEVSCSCKAGSPGLCKHSVGVLIYINRHPEMDMISKTELPQKWHQMSIRAKYEPKPVFCFCHVKSVPHLDQTESEGRRICSRFFTNTTSIGIHHFGRLKEGPESVSSDYTADIDDPNIVAIPCEKVKISETVRSLFENGVLSNSELEPYEKTSFQTCTYAVGDITFHSADMFTLNDLSEKCLSFFQNHVVIDFERSCELFVQTISQANEMWHASRRCRITGSICYALFTYGNRPGQDWDKKLASVLNSKFKGNDFTQYGSISEDTAINCYEQQTGRVVFKCGFAVLPTVSWLGFSADGVVFCDGNPSHLIEIKSPVAGQSLTFNDMYENKKVPYVVLLNGYYTLRRNHRYYAQCQLGLAVLNLPYCDFLVFSKAAMNVEIIKVERDVKFIEELLNKLQDVYFTKMLPYLCSQSESV